MHTLFVCSVCSLFRFTSRSTSSISIVTHSHCTTQQISNLKINCSNIWVIFCFYAIFFLTCAVSLRHGGCVDVSCLCVNSRRCPVCEAATPAPPEGRMCVLGVIFEGAHATDSRWPLNTRTTSTGRPSSPCSHSLLTLDLCWCVMEFIMEDH